MMDEPGADGMPKGWDPIRVSTAWPAIPASLLDLPPVADAGAETPPWEAAPWAEDPSAADQAAARASAVVARSPGGVGASRTWVVAVAVVLLCVLAVVLAIFA
jgi:hypothetical protein